MTTRSQLDSIEGIPGTVGFVNLGNTCYMNSVLQCMLQIQQLFEYETIWKRDLNVTNPLGSKGAVVTAYYQLLVNVWSGKYSCINPSEFKHTFSAFCPIFHNTLQHDAQEFALSLLDAIHEDLNRAKKKDKHLQLPSATMPKGVILDEQQLAIKTWKHHLEVNDSIIVDHFQGMHRTLIICPHCKKKSTKFDVYSSLALTLKGRTDGHPIQLEDCLKHFCQKEELDEDNAWLCTNCKENVNAMKSTKLWTTPDVLIVHLKRFTFARRRRGGGMQRCKIEDIVDFPVDYLDLKPFMAENMIDTNAPPTYELFGVVEHQGLTPNSGHYTSTIRNAKDGRWYR